MLIVPTPKEHNEKIRYFASPQGKTPEDPPAQPPTRIVKDGGIRICHCEPQKSKPNPPRRQYGSVGSIDNSELNILLIDKKDLPKWADELTTGNVSEMRNIKGANNMRNHYDGKLDEYSVQENNQEPYFNRETGVYEKPPIGIMPHKIWLEKRIQELSKAIERYTVDISESKNRECVIKWLKELTDLLIEYSKEK